MIRTRLILFMMLMTGLAPYAASQSDEEQLSELERMIENQERSADMNTLDEDLVLKPSGLLDLNQATALELLSIHGFVPLYVKAIIKHRLEFGAFVSLLELQTIDEIPSDLIYLLRRHLILNPAKMDKKQLWSDLKTSKKEVIAKLSTSRPFSIGYVPYGVDSVVNYLGSPQNYQLRFRANSANRIIFGCSAEKDKGEEFFKANNLQGFDFYSFHFYIANQGWLKKVAIGDFQTSFGQGLTMSNGFGLSKSATVLNVKQNASGLRPYRSMNEQNFFRGAGMTFGKNKIESTLFISNLKMDAHADSIIDESETKVSITSFSNTGLHRTSLEKNKKNTASIFVLGQDVNYKIKNLNIGLVGVYQSFDKPLFVKDRIYNRYYFSGKSFLKGGLYLNFLFKNINFFGESSLANQDSYGYLAGLFMSLSNDFDFVIVHRRYSKNFIGYNSNAFGENSATNNEQGLYIGFVYKPTKSIHFSCYVDRYKTPWYTYDADGRGKGVDFLAEMQFKPNKTTLMYVRFKTKSELQNSQLGGYNALNFVEKDNLRVQAETKITPKIVFKTRFEFSKHEKDKVMASGNLSFLDLIYRPNTIKITLITRFCFFNINTSNVRIYTLENDVLNNWAVTGFSGSGTKIYGIVSYKLNTILFQMRYAYIKYYDRQVIGNAFDSVNSNYLHEINLLLRYGFD